MASAGIQPSPGNVTELDIYKQHCEWRTRYADNRFKQLTLWSGAMALLVTAGFHHESGLSLQHHPFAVPLLGVLLTFAFWVMEVSSTLKEIEVLERLKPYHARFPGPKLNHWTFLNHTNVTLLLYSVSLAGWTILVFYGGLGISAVLMLLVCEALLVIFTIREYAHLWRDAARNWQW